MFDSEGGEALDRDENVRKHFQVLHARCRYVHAERLKGEDWGERRLENIWGNSDQEPTYHLPVFSEPTGRDVTLSTAP